MKGKAADYASQSLVFLQPASFFRPHFLEILMLFLVKFLFNLLRACYAFHDFLRARGSIFSGLHPFKIFAKCNALVLLRQQRRIRRCAADTRGPEKRAIPSGLKSLQQFRVGLRLGPGRKRDSK
jgi:hypothetical protein